LLLYFNLNNNATKDADPFSFNNHKPLDHLVLLFRMKSSPKFKEVKTHTTVPMWTKNLEILLHRLIWNQIKVKSIFLLFWLFFRLLPIYVCLDIFLEWFNECLALIHRQDGLTFYTLNSSVSRSAILCWHPLGNHI